MSYKRQETFAWDPVVKKHVIAHEDSSRSGDWVFETKVDVTDIVETNKAQYAQTDERARWGKMGEVWAKVASIPEHLYFSALKQGLFDPNDDKSLLSWIQNRDNLAWRTRPGRLL